MLIQTWAQGGISLGSPGLNFWKKLGGPRKASQKIFLPANFAFFSVRTAQKVKKPQFLEDRAQKNAVWTAQKKPVPMYVG